jgi:HAMP domain-containing protein
MSDPAEPDGTGSGHGTAGEGAGSAGVSWSEDDAHGVRVAISAADQFTRRHLIEETAEIKSDAERAATLGLGALLLTAPIALLSTFVVVRGILRPLDRLSAGTTAVASGRFGIELPVRGKDELSELARAFNTMSTSLAVLDRMKADFINVVAHELKTPLACVKGYAGALRASLPPELHGGEIRGYLDRIDREADLLSRVSPAADRGHRGGTAPARASRGDDGGFSSWSGTRFARSRPSAGSTSPSRSDATSPRRSSAIRTGSTRSS